MTAAPREPAAAVVGVTVVMATFHGASRIAKPLSSLAAQSLDPACFEVVVVVNGPDDGVRAVVADIAASHPRLGVRVLTSDRAGASAAWSLGVAAARREYLTFVDDDDWVSPDYLAGMLERAAPWTIVAAAIADVDETRPHDPNWDNYLQRELDRLEGEVSVDDYQRAIGYHGGKLVATALARQVPFDLDLASGMDVAFWTELVGRFLTTVTVVPRKRGAHYYRTVRRASMGRNTADRGFAQDRVAVLGHLSRMRHVYPDIARAAHRQMIGQMHWLGTYLDEHPEDRPGLLEQVVGLGDPDMPYESLTRNRSRDLAVLVAFPPFVDVSAIVAARRIWAEQRIVDVVTMDLSDARPVDPDLELLVAGLVDHRWVVTGGPVRYSSWNSVRRFVNAGIEPVQREIELRGAYRSVYSRTTWPAAHFLAAMVKLRNPSTRWVAEFSDPQARTITGAPRLGGVLDDDLLATFDEAMRAHGFPSPGPAASLFEWCEALAYALADELVFTNELQREYMAGYCPDGPLREALREKSRVAPHPIPAAVFTGLRQSSHTLDPTRVNIGYFGSFYVSRGLAEVTRALAGLAPEQRSRLCLHVFTDRPEESAAEVAQANLSDVVRVSGYLPYLEFLALIRRFDVLLVNDAATSSTHPVNPYLPSKLSDYLGSGRPIWAVAEPGSVLSGMPLAHRSGIGDVAGAAAVLSGLAGSATGGD